MYNGGPTGLFNEKLVICGVHLVFQLLVVNPIRMRWGRHVVHMENNKFTQNICVEDIL